MSFNAPGSPPAGPPAPAAEPVAGPLAGSVAAPVLPGPQPLPGFAPQPQAFLRSPRGVATATTVLLALCAVAALSLAGTGLYAGAVLRDGSYPDAGSEESFTLPDMLMALAAILPVPLLIATAALFIIWFHRVHRNAAIFNPGAITESGGWAVGSWFIPLGNLVLPYRTAKEIWAASLQLGPDGAYRPVSTAPVTSWWLLWVSSLIAERVFSIVYERADSPAELSSAADAASVQGLLSLAAAVLAIRFVRKLTALQTVKAAQGPYAAV
ncbi:DUF4328 domain-containing protein [Streptomyces sp. ISL-66]|uniref:DUF4328 domain-containing protein n=1 Tax=Streptomyces sp. ISL-66 TaxID=2819186 RepID=UPI001BE96882|nr:DUF4328 domain-containing protein [Streptomyces sp. ISL-66]MBT2466682.1 DUF4328 domain-containing protein [Streptomyces sp. ISL-66]